MILRRCTPLLLALAAAPAPTLLSAGEPHGAGNLVRNAGLEGAAEKGLPPGWSAFVIGPPARFSLDGDEKHGGSQSVRITATEAARSYLRSEPIEVAPGEKLRTGAWVKVKDVPAGQGTVIVIADYTTSSGAALPAMKVSTANVASGEWQPVSAVLTAPPAAVRLRLRMGFSYSLGTAWWDDVTVRAERRLVARIELPDTRLSPAMPGVPVGILNRGKERGSLAVALSGAGATAAQNVELTGEPLQRVTVPLKGLKRGKGTLELTVSQVGRPEPVARERRPVVVPPPVTLAPLIPTHWVIEDGAPRFQAEVALDVAPEECRGSSLATRVLDQAGAERAVVEVTSSQPGAFRPSLSCALPEGEYRVQAEFRPAQGPPVKVEQPWAVIPRRKASVRLNAAGYLEREGKAVFPLGIFNGGARMRESGAAGFTVSHAYNAVRVQAGRRGDDQRAKDFLDLTEKAGMHALFLLPQPWAEAGEWDAFRRRIRMFRNHPALLAWDEEEGLARGDMKPETLEKIRQVLQEEDPHHPFMVGDSRDVIGRVTDRSNFFPAAQMDMGMWWWYPLPLAPSRAGDALRGEEAARSRELVPPIFLTKANTGKPLWVGVQAYKKPAASARYPNAAEYRAQAYLALISGARGLMWYGGSVQGGLFLSPKEGDWEALKSLATELRGLSEVMMGSTTPAKVLPGTALVSAAVKQGGGRRVLLAVNRGPAPTEVAMRPGGDLTGAVNVPGESRSVTASGGEIRDRFGPYGAHVYELK